MHLILLLPLCVTLKVSLFLFTLATYLCFCFPLLVHYVLVGGAGAGVIKFMHKLTHKYFCLHADIADTNAVFM